MQPDDLIAVYTTAIAGTAFMQNFLVCVHCGKELDLNDILHQLLDKKLARGNRKIRHQPGCSGRTHFDH